jgi:hypothetical protein
MNTITQVLETRYGVGAVCASPTTIQWAIDHALVEQRVPAERVRRDLCRLNALRVRRGQIPAYVSYGHPIF